MATRPAGNPPIWAQTTNYPAGADPWSGMATKVTAPTASGVGFTPETGIVSDYMNDQLNTLSTWVEWLSFGSSAGAEDAHVIEADSTGLSAIAGLVIGGTTAAFAPITVTANSGATGSAITTTNNAGGFALLAASNAALAAVRGTCQGTGPGVEGLVTGGSGPGVRGTGNGASTGVEGIAGATGEGVTGTCTGAGNFGVKGSSSATNADSFGVKGEATQTASGGVHGVNLQAGAATTNSGHSGVFGESLDSTGVYGISTNGYGMWAESDTTAPARAALHIDPQDTDPTAQSDGDIWYHSGEDHLKGRIDGIAMGIWSTQRGYAYLFGANDAQVDETTTNFTDVFSVSFASKAQPRVAGAVMTVTVCFEFGASSTGQSFQWKLIDDTATADVFVDTTEEVHNSGATANDRYLVRKTQYTIPGAGARTFILQIRSVDGFVTSRVRKASIEITGSHG